MILRRYQSLDAKFKWKNNGYEVNQYAKKITETMHHDAALVEIEKYVLSCR